MSSREILYGKNVVREVLRAGKRKVFKIYGARKDSGDRTIPSTIPLLESSYDKISQLTGSREHQGIAIEVSSFEYSDFGCVVEETKVKNGFLILLDEIQDPHNVGALIRTAHLCGASGMVVLKHRQAPITAAVCKAAAGATEYLPIVKETNLVNVIQFLKENNFTIYGAVGKKGGSLFKTKFSFPLALVLGSEGEGLRRLVRENCDYQVTIPMQGQIDSFNVSVAGGILMGEIIRAQSLNA